MNPAGRARGCENMMPAYIGQPAGHEKGSATALSPPRSAMFSLSPSGAVPIQKDSGLPQGLADCSAAGS